MKMKLDFWLETQNCCSHGGGDFAAIVEALVKSKLVVLLQGGEHSMMVEILRECRMDICMK